MKRKKDLTRVELQWLVKALSLRWAMLGELVRDKSRNRDYWQLKIVEKDLTAGAALRGKIVTQLEALRGTLAEMAFVSLLVHMKLTRKKSWDADDVNEFDEQDFWLMKDGKITLTIDVKSAYIDPPDLREVELLVNQRSFNHHKSKVYVLVQVLTKKKLARILGYATVNEVESNGRIKQGRTVAGDYIQSKAEHTIDELLKLIEENTSKDAALSLHLSDKDKRKISER